MSLFDYQNETISKLVNHEPLADEQSSFPQLALVELTHYDLINISGPECLSYLQGQLTNNLSNLDAKSFQWQAHCNEKGKTISAFPLFHRLDGYSYLQPKSITKKQIDKLMKYSIFSKISIEIVPDHILAIMGSEASRYCEAIIKERFPNTTYDPTLNYHDANFSIIYITTDCYLFISEVADLKLINLLLNNLKILKGTIHQESLWSLYCIKNNFPIIENAHCEQYIPQALNLHTINAIDFSKGCYLGQETIAKAQYRGANNKQMRLIQGTLNDLNLNHHLISDRLSDDLSHEIDRIPLYKEIVSDNNESNFRPSGFILCYYRYKNGASIALAVLPNSLEDDTILYLTESIDKPWQLLPQSVMTR